MKITSLYNGFLRSGLILALLIGETTFFATMPKAQAQTQPGQPGSEPPQMQQPIGGDPSDESDQPDEPIEGTTELSAVVREDGTFVQGRGVGIRSSAPLGVGYYEVIFRRNVSNCVYVATIGVPGNDSVPPPGEISVASRFGKPRGVFVSTYNSAGVLTNKGFHLVVVCPGS